MSWGGSEKNRWFQLDVSISMLWSSGERLDLIEQFLFELLKKYKMQLDYSIKKYIGLYM